MKDVGRSTKKANFQVKKGFKAYSRLSIVTGLVILGAIPLAIWSYTQHPEWLSKITQSINGDEDLKNSSDNTSEAVNSAQTKNDNQQKNSTKEPSDPAKKDLKKATKQETGSTLASQIFRQLPDKTLNLGKEKERNSRNSSPLPKPNQFSDLFPALPKTFISPYGAQKENNTSPSQQIATRRTTLPPQVNPYTENPLGSSLRQFNTNSRVIAPNSSNSPYLGQTYGTSPYQGQTYGTSPYQGQTYGNAQVQQPYSASPYQGQTYGNAQVQQPYGASPYQVQPYGASPYQVQPYAAGVQTNPYSR